MPWKPGESGNPSGKPSKSKEQKDFEESCRKYLNAKGFKIIQKMADSKDMQNKRWALEQLLNRGFGKSTESVDVTQRHERIPSADGLADALENIISIKKKKGSADTTGPDTKH